MNRKRIVLWSVVLFIFLNLVTPVHASEASEDTIDLIDTFYVTTTQEDHSMHVPFSRSWCREDARGYNHDLAKLSLGLATSAFRPNKNLADESYRKMYTFENLSRAIKGIFSGDDKKSDSGDKK